MCGQAGSDTSRGGGGGERRRRERGTRSASESDCMRERGCLSRLLRSEEEEADPERGGWRVYERVRMMHSSLLSLSVCVDHHRYASDNDELEPLLREPLTTKKHKVRQKELLILLDEVINLQSFRDLNLQALTKILKKWYISLSHTHTFSLSLSFSSLHQQIAHDFSSVSSLAFSLS